MSVSKTTKLTASLMAEIAASDSDDALRALDYLVAEAANTVYDSKGTWAEKRRVLDSMAKFTAARAEQAVGLVDEVGDPDEDLL